MSKTTSKTILITGASSGFGRDTAETLARAGHNVFASMRDVDGKHRDQANELRKQVDRFRNKVRIIAVHGGDPAVNRAACEDERVDILLHPADGKTSGVNHVLAKLAADKYVAIGFELQPIICNKGGSRVRALSYYKTNFALAKKYGVPFVVVSGAMSTYDMRDVRASIALCRLFGMGKKDAVKGLSFYPSEILRRRSPGYIMEGVELVD